MWLVAMASMVLSMGVTELPAWTFDTDAQGWTANQGLANVTVQNGMLCADGINSDPFFTLGGLNVETKPWQYVVISLKASADGEGQLFWTGETTGQYGGFVEAKSVRFPVSASGTAKDAVVFPFWQSEGVIRQLRLDLYNGAHFEIDAVRVMSWGGEAQPATSVFSWSFNGDITAWRVHPGAPELFAPPLSLDVSHKGWAEVTLKSDINATGSILWSARDTRGLLSAEFAIEAEPNPHTYLIELNGIGEWHSAVVAFGIRLPEEKVRLDAIKLVEKPEGIPDLAVTYLGAEDALNRVGIPARILAVIANRGGSPSEAGAARLVLSSDLRFHDCGSEQPLPSLAHGDTAQVSWTVAARTPNAHKIFLKVGKEKMVERTLTILKTAPVEKADYVPRPSPVRTRVDVCAFYFPGWDSDAKWDCLRSVAPMRRPALGYYDESNPECVDWQIKWAVENGISCFLVDWYWTAGSESLTHWFEAYRKARYRDMLRVAIMWANHNAPDTHSVEDWRNVTAHWIKNYFNLPAYYRIKGKPAVFIWAPGNIRRDLKGSEAVKQCLAESQAMAQQAGLAGISFVAMGDGFSPDNMKALLDEGYTGITTYHEWGSEAAKGRFAKRMDYSNVVKNAPNAWEKKNAACGGAPPHDPGAAGALTYYPVVDTGWDSRPWEGDKAFMIQGRTPELFQQLLERAKAFAAANKRPMVVLGPMNEWGEGSYIEPCVQYGFDMLEAVRAVFALGMPQRWPLNIGPRDIGCGPYDFPPRSPVNAWIFDGPEPGWKAMMGVGGFTCAEGQLRFRTTSTDPAIVTDYCGAEASVFSKAVITMQVSPLPLQSPIPNPQSATPNPQAQLFWSSDSQATSEPASVRFSLIADGAPHDYTLDLKANPRWRGRITLLRFDPCDIKDVLVAIDAFRLEP
jgi:hypothetical protein